MHPQDKIITSLAKLSDICEMRKVAGEKIVLTSGCFDLLHGGHLEYIYGAATMGSLVVGINNDVSVKKLKGNSRPIRKEDDRAFTMAGFYSVQNVIVFESDYDLIEAVKPDFYVASATSRVRVHDDSKRLSLLKDMRCKILEMDSLRQDSTSNMIQRASNN